MNRYSEYVPTWRRFARGECGPARCNRQGEGLRREGIEGADIDVAHRVGGGDADGGQVAGGDDRQRQAQPLAAFTGRLIQRLVMFGDGFLQRLLFLRAGFAGAAGEQISAAAERNGAQHGARLAVAPVKHHDLLLKGALRARDHRGVQAREQFPRFVQRRYRVVVAAQHHQLAAGALQFHHEAVVQLTGVAGR